MRTLLVILSVLFLFIFISACSTKKNTTLTRLYHSVNTRYNIYYNADIAYNEALDAKEKSRDENLSQILYIFPQNADTSSVASSSGSFTTTIDKTTKAIKLHSITAKPRKDPNKRKDAEYQAWLKQKEYTPFMDVVWMLLAKAELQEGDYLKAVSTFLYISKIYSSQPEIVAECQLWVARTYTEMGWMYEAGNILHKMDLVGGPPEKHKGLYALVKANYLVYNNEKQAAIPYVEAAIKKGADKHQKLKLKYLLGQLYAEVGDNQKAYKAFGSVQGLNTPYKYTFNAKLQQVQLDNSLGKKTALSQLEKMSRNKKNEEYLDQIYYTVGNIYLENGDTVRAIDNYRESVTKSTRNGYDKMLSEIELGDLYFHQRKFILAQPFYANALSSLAKSHPDYFRVSLRSGVLDELVVHVKTLVDQDSLQFVASLPEAERIAVITAKIEALKKEEELNAKEEEHQRRIEERDSRVSSWGDLELSISKPNPNQPVAPINASLNTTGDASFYFYNKQAVDQGKIAFQKQWGTRKLEDDWRRRNKVLAGSNDFNETDTIAIEAEVMIAQEESKEDQPISEDKYSVDYYIQQLPLTAEAIAESNVLIENALFNMGKIYKDKLEDNGLAIDAFNTDIRRFPSSPNLEEMYYQLLLIYMQIKDQNMMNSYRAKLLSEFSTGKYALPLSQPDYEWNFRHMASLQDSLYNQAFEAYRAANTDVVRENYEMMRTKYPFTDLMPNFSLLNALTYAQKRDAAGLEHSLDELIKEYPKAGITPLATEILKKVKDGDALLSDGSPVIGFNWDRAYENGGIDESGEVKTLQYSDTLDVPYMLLFMFKPQSIDRNNLLYQVADYNFSNYVIQTYDLSFGTEAPYEVLQVKGFDSFSPLKSYLTKAFDKDKLIQNIEPSILVVPISVENYTTVLPRLGLERYISFFTDHYGDLLPKLISYWKDGTYDLTESEPEEELEPESEKQEPAIEEVHVEKQPTKPVQQPVKQDVAKEPVSDKQINLDDVLNREQLDATGRIVEHAEDILDNPVEGLKNLLNKTKSDDSLTKEEKATLKAEEKVRKQQEKEAKAIDKARQDSIKKVERFRADSIKKVEKLYQDSISTAKKIKEQELKLEEKNRKDAVKAEAKERENRLKEKEAERKEKERLRKERVRQQEREREQKLKERERERQKKLKEAEEKRK